MAHCLAPDRKRQHTGMTDRNQLSRTGHGSQDTCRLVRAGTQTRQLTEMVREKLCMYFGRCKSSNHTNTSHAAAITVGDGVHFVTLALDR